MNVNADNHTSSEAGSTPSTITYNSFTTTIEISTVYTSGNENSTTGTSNTITTMTTGPTSDSINNNMYIIIGAVFGAVIAIIIGATMIICSVISMKKNRRRKASVDLTDSEKNPNRDGYINALYDSKSKRTPLSYNYHTKNTRFNALYA